MFILDYRNDARQKNFWAIFKKFKLKMGLKAGETTHNINNASGRGTANKHAVQQWTKKFCNGDESLEVEV